MSEVKEAVDEKAATETTPQPALSKREARAVEEARAAVQAPAAPEPVYYLVLMDLRVPMGRQLVPLRRGQTLHPEHDAHIITVLKTMYLGKTPPLRRMSEADYVNMMSHAVGW